MSTANIMFTESAERQLPTEQTYINYKTMESPTSVPPSATF